MSKRNEGRQIGDEPAAAKPRPTCLISRNLLNVRQASSLDPDASNIPGNPPLDSNSVQKSTGVCRSEIKTQQRILKSGINPCPGSTWRHEQSDVCERYPHPHLPSSLSLTPHTPGDAAKKNTQQGRTQTRSRQAKINHSTGNRTTKPYRVVASCKEYISNYSKWLLKTVSTRMNNSPHER